MYKDILLSHYRNPQNFGYLKKKTHSASVYNALCGDRIQMDILYLGEIIQDITFTGEGCVVSVASASLLTDYVKEKKRTELINLDRKFMIDLLGMKVSLGRIKCLMLPLEALQKTLKIYD